jgi:hypothetical protein
MAWILSTELLPKGINLHAKYDIISFFGNSEHHATLGPHSSRDTIA